MSPEDLETRMSASILSLPEELLLIIAEYLPYRDLYSLSQVSKQFQRIYYHAIEKLYQQQPVCFLQGWNRNDVSVPFKYKVSQNWLLLKLFKHRVKNILKLHKQMPDIQLTADGLWVTDKAELKCFEDPFDRPLTPLAWSRRLRPTVISDICSFNVQDGHRLAYTGNRKGHMCCYALTNQASKLLSTINTMDTPEHSNLRPDVQAVVPFEDVVVTASLGGILKLWSLQQMLTRSRKKPQALLSADTNDRILSVTPSTGRSFYVGCAGTCDSKTLPVRLFDMERFGAGILDMFTEPHLLYGCGYDTTVSVWDNRCCHKCVQQFMEPFDSPIYCVRPVGKYALLTGTARHGMMRLWDKRNQKSPLKLFYCASGARSSPVYSMVVTPTTLLTALDDGIYSCDFSRH